jgi:hypothetical protein
MRWLVQRGDTTSDAPQLLTLNDSSSDAADAPSGIQALPGGALSITVRNPSEARQTLAELQRVQQALLMARARATGDGVNAIGSSVRRTVQRPNRHLRSAAALAGRTARRFRPSATVSRGRQVSSTVIEGLDIAILVAETAGGIDDALKLIGTAIEAVGGVVSDIDLGGFDFD